MNDLQIFNNEEFGTVRTVTGRANDIWFVGKDVAEALGYSDTRKAVAMHVDGDDKTNCPITDSLGRTQDTTVINESGLYALILGSKLPTAKKFKHWVTSEVLPSIRRTGGYSLPQTYKEALKALLVAEEEKERLALANLEMQPKADYFDELVDRKLNLSFRNTAKELGIKEKSLIGWLLAEHYIFRDAVTNTLRPYAKFTESGQGYFTMKEYASQRNSHAGTQTLITPKGRETFRVLLERA